MEVKDTKRNLTPEQITMLEGNPNVVRVTLKSIIYTSEFKNKFSSEYHKGRSAREILEENGFDYNLLGKSRIASLRRYYGSTWRPRYIGIAKISSKTKQPATTEDKLSRLEHEVAYMSQEVEFLKKIFIANQRATKIRNLKRNQE